MANFEIKTDLKNLDRLLEEIERAKRLSVNIGIDESAEYNNGTKVADVATYLEYGWVQITTPAQRGYLFSKTGLHIGSTLSMPPRPIFGFTIQTCKGKWWRTGSRLLKNFIENPYAIAFRTMQVLGMMATQDLRTTVLTNGKGTFPARSPLTLLLYGSDLSSHQPKGDEEKLKKRNITKKNTSNVSKALVRGTDGAPKLLNSFIYEVIDGNNTEEEKRGHKNGQRAGL